MLRARGVGAVVGFALSTSVAAGCSANATCTDCTPDGAVDAPADVTRHDARSDAGSDGSGKHHDAGAEASKPEAGKSDATSPDAKADVFTCDGTKTPSEAPCVISETYGVFVAPAASGGSDSTGTGTRTAPYGTIGNAITKAAGKRVYVCDATYTESLTVNAAVDGTQIYGGLVCPGDAGTAWTYATGTVASVSPTVQGYALDVESLAKGAHFEDVAFTALDGIATTPGASSIAVMVNASLAVSFTRVKATAGKGVAGTSATPVTPGGAGDNWCPAAMQAGSAATGTGGGNSGTCACAVVTADSSTGGPGGG